MSLAPAHESMSRFTCVIGRKEPLSTNNVFLYKASEGCKIVLSGLNSTAFVNPSSTSCKLCIRLSKCSRSGPLNVIMSTPLQANVYIYSLVSTLLTHRPSPDDYTTQCNRRHHTLLDVGPARSTVSLAPDQVPLEVTPSPS